MESSPPTADDHCGGNRSGNNPGPCLNMPKGWSVGRLHAADPNQEDGAVGMVANLIQATPHQLPGLADQH